MKKLSWRALVMALVPLILLTAMGSRGNAIKSSAAETLETSEVVRNLHDPVYESNGEKVDVCFYIRGNGIGGDIPAEPGDYPRSDYSDPIRINGIASGTSVVASSGSEDNLCSDGFTAANEVTALLDRVPAADEIRGVVGEFDPEKHFVIWYVIKNATTSDPNRDVRIHVDGVIKIREGTAKPTEPEEPQPQEPQPEVPEEPQPQEPQPEVPEEPQPQEPQPEEPEILFSIETAASDAEMQYDGKEHVIGGYVIRISSLKDPDKSLVRYYGPYGEPYSEGETKAGTSEFMADEGSTSSKAGEQTVITFMDNIYTVNVGGAYTTVNEPGRFTIPFYSGDKIVPPEDIVVYDSYGNTVGTRVRTQSSNGSARVTPRKITIQAGSTVRNDDGSTITNNEVTITKGSLVKGHKLTDVVFNGSQTGVGSSVNEITSYRIVDARGKDVTSYYSVTRVNGKLVLVDGNAGRNDSDPSLTEDAAGGNAAAARTLGKTGAVTVSNTPPRLGEGNEVDAVPMVLGARRSATSDVSDLYGRILLMILAVCCILAAGPSRRKTAEK